MNPAFQPGAAAWPATPPAQPAPLPLTAAQKLLLPAGALLFDWLFWLEGTGLNVLVFTIFVVVAQLYLLPRHAPVRRSGYFWQAVAGSLFSAGMVAVYGSGAAGLATLASLAMLLGYVNQPHLKLVLYAVLTAGANWLLAGPRVLRGLRAPRNTGTGVRRGWFYARLLLVPLVVLVVFHLLFVVANSRYEAFSDKVLTRLGEWLALARARDEAAARRALTGAKEAMRCPCSASKRESPRPASSASAATCASPMSWISCAVLSVVV